MDLGKYLSKKDCLDLLESTTRGLKCQSEADFRKLVLDLQNLLSFECAVGGYFKTDDLFHSQQIPQEQLININYPAELLNWYFTRAGHLIDPVLIEFFKTFELQNWNDVTNRCLCGKKDVVTQEVEDFGLRDGFAYGVRNFNLLNATCFFLAGAYVENNERTRAIIKYAVPHLSEVLKRLVATKIARAKYPVTRRELEVLKWLKDGKSSWDISRSSHLGLSRFQVPCQNTKYQSVTDILISSENQKGQNQSRSISQRILCPATYLIIADSCNGRPKKRKTECTWLKLILSKAF